MNLYGFLLGFLATLYFSFNIIVWQKKSNKVKIKRQGNSKL